MVSVRFYTTRPYQDYIQRYAYEDSYDDVVYHGLSNELRSMEHSDH